jgi:hypothetical protein
MSDIFARVDTATKQITAAPTSTKMFAPAFMTITFEGEDVGWVDGCADGALIGCVVGVVVG